MPHFKVLGDITGHYGSTQPDAIAFKSEERTVTYGAFDKYSNQVANGLVEMCIVKGMHVGYLGKNSERYFEVLMGVAKVGAIMTPINWRLAAPEIAIIIQDAEVELIFVESEFEQIVLDIAAALPQRINIIALNDTHLGLTQYQQWRDKQSPSPPDIDVAPDDIAIQIYTSGTTGRAKGVMLTHFNLLEQRRILAEADIPWNRWAPEDVSLLSMPFAHIGGTGYGLYGLYGGCKGIILREFEVGTVLDAIEREKVSKLFLVPSAIQAVLMHPKARTTDYSRIDYLIYGASPIPWEVLMEGVEVFGCGFVQHYGMTEAAGALISLEAEDHSLEGFQRMRSAGKPFPGVGLAIIDQEGRHLATGEIGEICIKWVGNMVGYWKQPEATAAAIDSEGWLHSGDAGYVDAEGYVFIHDRIKDMIISGGENIYPAEIERALSSHPDIADVAVIGVPDGKWGEAVKAIVVAKAGRVIDQQDVITYVRTKIASYKAPKSVDVVSELPRNASGKILRRELREKYWGANTRRVN